MYYKLLKDYSQLLLDGFKAGIEPNKLIIKTGHFTPYLTITNKVISCEYGLPLTNKTYTEKTALEIIKALKIN